MTIIKQLSLAATIAALFTSSTVFATPSNDATNTMPNSDYFAATQYKEAQAPLNSFGNTMYLRPNLPL